jgi:lipoprotein-releasing system permease protein
MRVEYYIGLRYLFSRRNARYLSLFTMISIGGVFVGVMALIVILAVLNGFHDDLKQKILGTMPQVTIMSYNGDPISGYDSLISGIQAMPEVLSAAPLIYSEGMVVSEGKNTLGAMLRGIDPQRENEITEIGRHIYSGAFAFDEPAAEGQPYFPGVVLGSYMAQQLRIGVGDIVTVWAPRGVKITPFGLTAPWRKFRVMGVFETGLYDVDSKFVYLSLKEAQSFFGMKDAITDIEVRVRDIDQATALRERIVEKLGYPFTGTDWITYNKNLFEALKLEKAVMFIILTLIVLVASFNIIGTLTMLVLDKSREIGILRSMGLTSRSVGLVFVFDGLLIGAVGTGLGLAAGYLISAFLARYPIINIPGDVYFISSIPVIMRAGDFAMVTAASLLISLAATIYPAFRAARLSPVDAIRYE